MSNTQTNKVSQFSEQLNDLFDISHSNALNMIKIEDKTFLCYKKRKVDLGVC